MLYSKDSKNQNLDILLITGYEDFSTIDKFTIKINDAYKKFLNHEGSIIEERYLFPKGTKTLIKYGKGSFINDLLVGPNFKYSPSLNGIILSTILENNGFCAELINGISYQELMKNEVIEKYVNKNVLSIGISTTFIHSNRFLIDLVSYIKQRFPKSKIIVGGPFISNNKVALNCPEIDVFVFGRGENKIVEILEALKNDTSSLSKIKNISYRENAVLKSNPCDSGFNFIENLSPNWKSYLQKLPESVSSVLKKYFIFPIEAMIGCPYHCSFCSYKYNNIQMKTADTIIKEILTLVDSGVKNIGFWDSLFTLPHITAATICKKIIEMDLTNMRFYSYGNIRQCDSEVYKLMEKAGWQILYFGIESGSNDILNKMRKGFSREDVLSFFDMMKLIKSGIQIWGSFIIGHPGENGNSLQETTNLIKDIRVPFLNIQPLQIRKDSELYLHPDRYSLKFNYDDKFRDIFEWEHSTMTSEEAVQNALDLFINISNDSSSLFLETLFNITDLAHKFPPYKNSKNFSALMKIQKGICLYLTGDQQCDEKRDLIWSELFQNHFDLVEY